MDATIKKFDEESEYYFDEGCYIIELSNSADNDQISIARARVEPGVTTKWHRLNGITEQYIILEGTGLVEVGNIKPQQVQLGDVVTIPSMEPQRITNNGDHDLIFLAICTPRFVKEAYVHITDNLSP